VKLKCRNKCDVKNDYTCCLDCDKAGKCDSNCNSDNNCTSKSAVIEDES